MPQAAAGLAGLTFAFGAFSIIIGEGGLLFSVAAAFAVLGNFAGYDRKTGDIIYTNGDNCTLPNGDVVKTWSRVIMICGSPAGMVQVTQPGA